MTDQKLKPIKFSRVVGKDFSTTLKQRVNAHFKDNNISMHSTPNMVFKTIFMFALYFVPYGIVLSGLVTTPWMIICLFLIMGIGTSGIGLSVMHDANHGAYSKNATVNKVLGRMLNVIGGFASAWKIQHNVLHHTYTNIFGYDEDIAPIGGVLKLSPDDQSQDAHKFQHIYAWFLYGLMTLMWITTKDFQGMYRYKKMGLTNTENPDFSKLLWELIISKILYYTYMLVIPMVVLNGVVSWWVIPVSLLLMHYLAGFLLAICFQPGHVVPETNFTQPTTDLTVENNWMIHQLESTSNFARGSRLLSWLIGGINYQVEHHLFPNICHVHYRDISPIVEATAKEYGIPYHSHKTFFGALYYHTKMLKKLGHTHHH